MVHEIALRFADGRVYYLGTKKFQSIVAAYGAFCATAPALTAANPCAARVSAIERGYTMASGDRGACLRSRPAQARLTQVTLKPLERAKGFNPRHHQPGRLLLSSIMRTAFRRIVSMTKEQINAVLEKVRSWPEEDQEELAEVSREIEAHRTGVYILNEDERRAIDQAERSDIASDEEVTRFWKRHGIE
jgi:hypothetical protein